MNKIVRVAIVSYNSSNELGECISSAKRAIESTGYTPSIVVVDNNSTDNSLSVIKNNGANAVQNTINAGFAKATNQAILFNDTALPSKPDYVLILNPDTIMEEGSLDPMMRALNEDPKIAAVGPSLITTNPQAGVKDEYYLREPSLLSVLMFSTVLRRFFIKSEFFVNKFYSYIVSDKETDVPQIPGACLLTTSEKLAQIGLLDEDYAIWFEDVDWSHKARKLGYSLRYCPDSSVKHVGGASFDKWVDSNKSITFYVSMKTFFKKNRVLEYPFVVLVVCLNSLLLWVATRKKSHLVFMKAFVKQKKGVLPS